MPHRQLKRSEKLQLLLNEEELKAIDDWRFIHRLPSRAAALRELLRRGLLTTTEDDQPNADNAPTGEFHVVDSQVKGVLNAAEGPKKLRS